MPQNSPRGMVFSSDYVLLVMGLPGGIWAGTSSYQVGSRGTLQFPDCITCYPPVPIMYHDISHCIKYSTIRCFADDTRIYKTITCEGDVKALQDDLDAVVEWSANDIARG